MHDIRKMAQEIEDPIKDQLVCRQQIRLRWRKLDQPLSDSQLQLVHADNLRLMEVLVSGEESLDSEQQRDKEVFKELRKLDAKLNLMMSWLGQFMWQQQSMPELQSVSLSSKGLLFHGGIQNYIFNSADDHGNNQNKSKNISVCENDVLFMELFLEPRYPHPFTTVSKVVNVNSLSSGQELSVKFIFVSEQNQQWLDKYIFRLHRRQVASARKG